jgi:hypothetical protein
MEKYKYATTFNQDGTLVVNLYNDDSYKQHETGSYYLYKNVTIKEIKEVLEIEFEKCLDIRKAWHLNISFSTLNATEIELDFVKSEEFNYDTSLVKTYSKYSFGKLYYGFNETIPNDALVWKYINRGFNIIKTNVYKIKYFN